MTLSIFQIFTTSHENENCANNWHNSHNSGKNDKMTYFDKSARNVLTSAGSSAIISKLSLMQRHIQKKSKDNRRHGMRQSVLEKLLDGKKKLLTKPIAGDKINRLSLETTTKKNKKVVDKDKCF